MLQINNSFLNKMISLSKVNSGNSDNTYSGDQYAINSSVRLTADNFKVKFEVVNIGKNYFSGLSIIFDNATGESLGDYFFNLEKLQAIIESFNTTGDISLNMDDSSNLILSDGKRKGKCPSKPGTKDFTPHIPIMTENSSSHSIPACRLKEMFSKVKHCIAPKDEVREVLRGMSLKINIQNEMTIACADGKRCAMDKAPVNVDRFETYINTNGIETTKEIVSVVVPEKTIMKLLKLLDGTVVIKTKTEGSDGVEFSFFGNGYDVIFYSSLIAGTFPNYSQVIPSSYNSKMGIEKKPFVDILKRHRKFVDKLYKLEGDREEDNFDTVLKLDAVFSTLDIVSGHTEHGLLEDAIPMSLETNGNFTETICINTRYLLEASQEVYGDTVIMKLNGENSPVLIEGGNYKAVVMPIKSKK